MGNGKLYPMIILIPFGMALFHPLHVTACGGGKRRLKASHGQGQPLPNPKPAVHEFLRYQSDSMNMHIDYQADL
jgi:hypothetical protein